MSPIQRFIQNIYVSPFLVHLTRSRGNKTAGDCLREIIENKCLLAGEKAMSAAKFAVPLREQEHLFRAISFTETPLPEIQNFFNIANRAINLEPYGLVFMKKELLKNGVSPVIYINNVPGDRDAVVRALVSLRDTHPKEAAQIRVFRQICG